MEYKVIVGDVADLKSGGCRMWTRGNTGVSFVYERREVRWRCCTAAAAAAAAAAVVPLLHCADAFVIQKKCGMEIVGCLCNPEEVRVGNCPSLCSVGTAREYARTHTRSTVCSCRKTNTLEVRLLLLCRRCHSVKSLRCDAGSPQQ